MEISRVVELPEAELGLTAIKELAPMQPGDVAETRADIKDLVSDVVFHPSTSLERHQVFYCLVQQLPVG